MTDRWRRRRMVPGRAAGFTLLDFAVMAAIIVAVAALAIPLYANAQTRARIEKAQTDLQTLAAAVTMYADHMGTLPYTLTALTTTAVNGRNQSAGPFVATVPPPPFGGDPAWGAYAYTSSRAGTFSITAIGDGTTIVVP
jgi:general secretion pathway protein G